MLKFILIVFIGFNLWAKSKSSLGPSANPALSSYITSDEAATEIKAVLDEVSNNTRHIGNRNCKNITYISNANLIEIAVGDKKSYILSVNQSIDSTAYLESVCFKSESDNKTSISCTTRTSDINDKENSLKLDISYGELDEYKVLFTCPEA